jgi:excisionase family DNA binding protein
MNAEGPPLSCAQVAAALAVSSRFVQKLVHAGVLRAFRLPSAGATARPGRLRIPRAQVVELLGGGQRSAANVANDANNANGHKPELDSRTGQGRR